MGPTNNTGAAGGGSGRGERRGEGREGKEGGEGEGGEGRVLTAPPSTNPSPPFPLPAASLLQQSPQPAILEAGHMVSWSSKGGDVIALSVGGGAAAVSWVNHT